MASSFSVASMTKHSHSKVGKEDNENVQRTFSEIHCMGSEDELKVKRGMDLEMETGTKPVELTSFLLIKERVAPESTRTE